MAKANKKSKEGIENIDIKEAFDSWEKTLDTLVEQANKSLMPLLADTFMLGQKILKVYKEAYTDIFKKK